MRRSEPGPGDVVITSEGGGYIVSRHADRTIGRTRSEQEAMVLACGERKGFQVWLLEAHTGRFVAVECPIESPLERFGSMQLEDLK